MKKFLSDVLINCDLTVSGSTSLGAATGVTVATSDNSNKIATTAWVKGLGFSTANTTYLLDVPANTTNFRLLGSDSSTDTITLSAAGASSITRVSASELRITSTNSVDYISNVTFANDVITFTGVGEGFSGTINLSTYLTQAEGDARYLESYSETDTLDTVTSRDGVTTNTIGVGTINIIGTTAGQELLTVDGTNGRLFTVTDDLSDSLFSVNTIAGLPVIEVFSDNTIKLGNFANPIEIDSSANIVIPGTITASGYNDSNWNTAFNDRITSAAVSGTSTKTLTLTQGDGGTVTASWTDIEGTGSDGYVSSVAITNNALDFTGVGSGFAGSIDLLDIAPIQSVAGNGTTISTSYDGDTGQVVVTPIFNTTIAETGTGLVTSSTIWNYINDSILDIAPIQTVAGDGVAISTSTDTDTGQVNIGPIVNSAPTQNSGALVTSGGIWSYIDGLVYDNYQSWNLKTNNVQRTTVASGGTLDIVAGSNVSVAYGAGGVVTISSTDTNTDTNNYVTGLSFNTGNGILTAARQGLADLTIDLDGRYAPLSHTHSATDITSGTLASARLSGTYEINATGYSNTLLSRDNRIISPAEDNTNQLRFGFTSFTNDNVGPWADFLHLKSYADASGGRENLLMFSKSDMEIRLWQQDFNSSDNYADFRDVAFKDELEKPAILSNGSTPSLNTGISAAEIRTLIGAGTSSTDTNFYLSGASFNTGNGVLTLTVSGATDQTVDLDGRYLTSVPAEYVTATEITNYSINPRFGSTIGMGNDSAVIEFQDSNAYTKSGYWSTLDAVLINGDSNSNSNIILRTGNILVNQNQFISGKLGVQGVIELGDNSSTTMYMGAGDGVPEGTVIETFSADTYIGAFLDFTIYDDDKGNMRSGTLQLVFNADQVMFNEVNTMDIGDTTPCTLNAVNNAGTIDVRFTTPDPTFHIKYQVRTL